MDRAALDFAAGGLPSCTSLGTVLAVQANYCSVILDGVETSQVLLCTKRSRLHKLGKQVMVGDRVVVKEVDWVNKSGVVVDALERRSQLSRPPIANVDQVLLMFALSAPDLDPFQLTQFLLRLELEGLEICLCLNKADLISRDQQQAWQARLRGWGYAASLISLHAGVGLDALRDRLQGRITVVSGPSGVGKSSLINYLIPTEQRTVGHVSGKLARGRHTTRHVELFRLPGSGLLADSPGFNRPDLECQPEQLALLFPEARQRLQQASCQFHNCLHRDEPSCAVRGDWERYSYYRILLDGAIAHQAWLDQQGNPEATTKLKTRSGGVHHREPKLMTKKYRRTSRNVTQQQLQRLYNDIDS